ncbi:DUF4307 domain-containing protein [Nocardioides lentus]|uniref:DUF4307 domain-containing protein n=1 Tax=Nocardioides lentus TaxID=338077 RepID=UPI0031E02BA7
MDTSDTRLQERYGAPRLSARRVGVSALVAVGVVAAVWLAWVTLAYSAPDVRSKLVGWDIADDRTATAVLNVSIDPGVVATCRVRAVSEDHSVVGEVGFELDGDDFDGTGRIEQVVRTERRATALESLGCTTPGQPRPR